MHKKQEGTNPAAAEGWASQHVTIHCQPLEDEDARRTWVRVALRDRPHLTVKT